MKQRKTQRKNLTKQKLCLENQEQLLDLNILSEYEKTFVTARPSYQHICKNYEKLSDMLVKLSVLYNLAYKLNQRFISQMERRLCKITDKIIKISESWYYKDCYTLKIFKTRLIIVIQMYNFFILIKINIIIHNWNKQMFGFCTKSIHILHINIYK